MAALSIQSVVFDNRYYLTYTIDTILMESLQHQEKPISPERLAEVSALREATCDHAPHGDHAELICDCFDGMHQDAMNESRGIEGNPARLEALRSLWARMIEARQIGEA